MTIPLSHPLIATAPMLSDHGCLDRWEDEGGAVFASGRNHLRGERPANNPVETPNEKPSAVGKALTWLQYAARHTHHKKVSPDWRLALAAVRNGSSLKHGVTAGRRFA